MEPVGYKNARKVYALSRRGRLLKPRGEKMALHPLALAMLVYMGENSYDWPPTEENRRKGLPSRVYERGWDRIIEDFGMDYVGEALLSASDGEALITARHRTAVNRVSQAAKFLKEHGLIKELRKADVRREIPTAWLLLLGDDAENREVEAYARKCLGL